LSTRGEHMMANCFEIFDRSIGKHDSELDRVVSFLAQRLLGLVEHPVSVVWMDPLQHNCAVREALRRIKPPNSVTLLRPIENFPRSRVCGPGTGAAQPLCFGQISFAAAQPVFGLLGFIDVNRQPIELDDASLPIAERLATNMVPTKLAVRPA